ncbi:zinc finger CCCH domain-containing protein 29-like [Salvia miltiorrhiza]|uniref:zinc finger CCCH domain-containing protein 29-like n=1 Tax=Salvia miltiorrhiza TaxID=226208 RepID=UPI0025ACAA7B|nr:zinc finger CCCH domain-containing protein 29-like [Salvia miltiorrhiza]
MCGGSKSNLCSRDMDLEISHKSCSELLELAATDDLAGFIHEVEERGIDVNESRFWYGRSFGSKKMGFEERTPIMIASLYGSTQVLNYILQTCKVDVNKACGSDGATALHCAAAGGAWSSVEIAELLLAASCDINAVDANGKKPGELIAPCVRSSSGSKRRRLEMLLNGGAVDTEEDEYCKSAAAAVEKKEYPMDATLPDINNGVYGSDEFRMYNFKVKPCSRAYSHDWTECPFVHPGENARRRDPRKFNYTCVPCPDFKKGSCGKADSCEYAHGVFESWLHPAQYRTRLCKDEIGCARKVCFFAHRPDELRPLYASTGSAMPSPKSFGTDPSPPPSPMWQSLTAPPALQLPSSRLKTTSSSSPASRIGDLKPTNLDDFFGSLDPSIMSHLSLSPSPKINVNGNGNGLSHLRASYPSNAGYGFDTAAAVAAAVMNSRSGAFSKRSQSFGYRHPASSSPNLMPPSKLSGWGSPDGKVDWGFSGDDASKLRKSASFGIRSAAAEEPGRGVHEMMPHWIDQMYVEQEQMVA